jgi:hypothetical protein
MRYVIAIAVGLPSLLFSALPVTAQQCARPGVISLAPGYAYANLYQGASAKSKVISRLGNGQPICTLGVGSYFRKVQAGSLVGYIAKR